MSKTVIQKRKERERERRLKGILESAKKVFFSKGYLRSTMDEIALGSEISKPTVYQFFKTKDDLFYSLMLPSVESIGRELKKIDEHIEKGDVSDGSILINKIFEVLYNSYDHSPDAFRVIQLYQQAKLGGELNPEVRSALNGMGSSNFEVLRQIIRKGIERQWIKGIDEYELADLLWGLVVGVIQLEDTKADDKKGHRYKRSVLGLAESIIIEALATENESASKAPETSKLSDGRRPWANS